MGERERERKVIRRSSSFPTIARLMLIPVAGLLLIILWSLTASHLPEPSPQPKKEAKPVVRAAVVPRVTPRPAPAPARHGEIVLILDDVGFDRQPLSEAMRIDPNVNFSILPNARNATAFANALYARGFEVLCHLPMEPEGFPRVSPGPNAVLTTMTAGEIADTTRADVAAVPHAPRGDHHIGSPPTAHQRLNSTVIAPPAKTSYVIH